jgi:signal peptidase I
MREKNIRLRGVYVAIIVIVVINILSGKNGVMPFGYKLAVVTSESMGPELSIDDLVLIQKSKNLKEGDIALFTKENDFIINRIVSLDVENGTAVIQGDAGNKADIAINISDIRGKVIHRVPKIGKLVRLLGTPEGVLCVVVAVFLILELMYRHKEMQGEKRREVIEDEIRELVNSQKH